MILNVRNRNIRVHNANNQISYNSDYIAEFTFDDEWNGKIKTARFVQNGEYFDVVLVDDRCDIPPLKTGFVRVGVFTDSMTSTYVDVYFKTSIKDGSGNPTEPPEDVYAQLLELIESGMLKGKDGLTPYVGENGNWWIGDIDTGILARGYTPRKGVDYFTEEEVQQIQNEISEGAIGEFKTVVDNETATFNTNAENTLTGYNANAQEKFETYNANADSKFEAYNTNAETKFSGYNSNAEAKLSEYNKNDLDKTASYNTNADSKFTTYNENAESKLALYNQNADNRVAEFNAQTEQIQTDISELKSDLDELWENPSIYSNFQKGILNNGVIRTGNYRIVSSDIIHAKHAISIRIDSGRRIGVQGYDSEGNFLWDSGWKTEKYLITKGTYFRICISAFPSTTNKEYALDADIDTLLSYVKFNHIVDRVDNIEEGISEINYRIGDSVDINNADFEIGNYWSESMRPSDEPTCIRMANKKTYHVKKDFVISGNGMLLFRLYKKVNDTYFWVNENYLPSYVVPSDSDYCLVIKYADSRKINDIKECLSWLSIKLDGRLIELEESLNDLEKSRNDKINNYIPKYPYASDIATEETLRGLSGYSMQGGAINGNMLFYGMINADVNATIIKYDLSTNTEVLSVVGAYGHAGDMTYNTATDKLIVINGKSGNSDIFILNPNDLSLENTISVPYKLGAIAFNPNNNGYILEVCTDSSFWSDYSFVLVDSNFKELGRYEAIKNGYLMEGIECDGEFIYAMYAYPNIIHVYNMELKYLGYHKVSVTSELEFIAKYDAETFYISENTDKIIFKATRKFEWE